MLDAGGGYHGTRKGRGVRGQGTLAASAVGTERDERDRSCICERDDAIFMNTKSVTIT